MAEYLNKEMFLQSMGLLGDETKYGNRDKEHQNRSYSTWMGYEIMGSVEDSIVEEDVVEVVHGRWTETEFIGVSRCSYCDKPSATPDCMKAFHDYCPNCGAKMDGGNEDV